MTRLINVLQSSGLMKQDLDYHLVRCSLASPSGPLACLLLAGFWSKRVGVLGAIGSVVTYVMTVTVIPFMPGGWAESAGGFPAMVGNGRSS